PLLWAVLFMRMDKITRATSCAVASIAFLCYQCGSQEWISCWLTPNAFVDPQENIASVGICHEERLDLRFLFEFNYYFENALHGGASPFLAFDRSLHEYSATPI